MDKPRKKVPWRLAANHGNELTPDANTISPGASVNFDRWLCRYIWSLLVVQTLVGEPEPVGERCLKIAAWRLVLFTRSGRPEDRYACWEAIHVACSWLAQLERKGKS
jgi:hypothetical protein